MLFIRKKSPTLNTQNDSIHLTLSFPFVYPSLIHSNVLSHSVLYISLPNTLQFAFDNGDMSSPKRRVFIKKEMHLKNCYDS